MHESEERFGRLLRRLREAAALSQEELADRSGLSARAIGNLERGRSRPRAGSVRQIVVALGLDGTAAVAMTVAAGSADWPWAGPLADSAGSAGSVGGRVPVQRDGREGRLSDTEALLLLEVLGGVDPGGWDPEVRNALLRACAGSAAAVRVAGAVLAVEPDLPLRELARRLDGRCVLS
ncbi:helix-turn-helix domain-containing protein [Kitasatospora sp. NPDC096147]|uniref:helix-turn-helix domain-containing protein n=1 Tax=Kitasatospora sp. NPDC096147 TaxID=3364093 RepID=UPI00382E6799